MSNRSEETISLVEQLRFLRPTAKFKLGKDEFYMVGKVMHEAADDLDRLRTLNDQAADMLESAQSGYIPGCGPDERWKRERDRLVTRLRASK